jgi:hypothetical protein
VCSASDGHPITELPSEISDFLVELFEEHPCVRRASFFLSSGSTSGARSRDLCVDVSDLVDYSAAKLEHDLVVKRIARARLAEFILRREREKATELLANQLDLAVGGRLTASRSFVGEISIELSSA